MTDRSAKVMLLCLLLAFVGLTMSKAFDPWYYPQPNMKRIFNSPSAKVYGYASTNKSLIAPNWDAQGSYLYDWQDIDYDKKRVIFDFPCNMFPAFVLKNKIVLVGNSLPACPCTAPGDMACPTQLIVKEKGAAPRIAGYGEQSSKGITIAKMKSDIVDAKCVLYKNDLPPNTTHTAGGAKADPKMYNGCVPPTNGDEIKGNAAVIRLGNCDATLQLKNAKAAGAVAVLFIGQPGLGTPGVGVSEMVLPGVGMADIQDQIIGLTDKINASIEITISFGPRIGSLTPQLNKIGNSVPPGLAMASLQTFETVSRNTKFFFSTPSAMFVAGENIIYVKINDTTGNQTIYYLGVSGEFNEDAKMIKSFDLNAKGYHSSKILTLFSANGHNYLVTLEWDPPGIEAFTLMFWDITDESTFQLTWKQHFTGYLLPEPIFINQTNRLYLIVPLAFFSTLDAPSLMFFDLQDPSNPVLLSTRTDPSLYLQNDTDGYRQDTNYEQWSYVNGYLILLTYREGVQIWDVTDMSNPKLHADLLRYTPLGQAQNLGFWGGYDITYLEYKNHTLICSGQSTNWYAYSQGVCYAFGSTSPFTRTVKKTPFPSSALKTRRIQDTPSTTSTPTPTMSSNGTSSDDDNLDLVPSKTVVGGYHACALFQTGSVRCWGQYGVPEVIGSGMLGYGTQKNLPVPTINIVSFEEQAVASKIIDLSAGIAHSCAVLFRTRVTAILKAYSIYCWGAGRLGRLGYGDEQDVGYPQTPLSKGPLKFYDAAPLKVFCGTYHTCAILKNVTANHTVVRCWGDSSLGQLGYKVRPLLLDASTAQDLPIGGEPVTLALGSFHTCALITDGRVKCWGTGSAGQTGMAQVDITSQYDSRDPATLPFVQTPNNMKVLDVCAGSIHTCVLLEDHQVYCMGSNDRGQSGQPIQPGSDVFHLTSLTKVNLPNGNETIRNLTCGFTSTCVTFASGAYLCWGDNSKGIFGIKTSSEVMSDVASLTPVRINGTTVEWLSSGPTATCAVLTVSGNKRLRCWGQNLITSIVSYNDAVDIWPGSATVNYVKQVVAYRMTCALLPDGSVKCWGSGNFYQLGTSLPGGDPQDGQGVLTPASNAAPVIVQYLPKAAVKLYVQDNGACALMIDGDYRCWGYNDYNGGINTILSKNNVTQGKVVDMALPQGSVGACMIFEEGDPWCYSNLLWRGGAHSGTLNISGITGKIIQIAMGQLFHCVLNEAGQVACFGINVAGQLALGNNSIDWVRMDNTDLAMIPSGRVKKLSAGLDHACALYESGDVACWGSSLHGQTGYGSIEDMGDDEPVEGFVDIGPYPAVDLSCGNLHTCVVVQGPDRRHLVCWGSNEFGQVGYPHVKGNIGDDESPAQVGLINIPDDIVSVASGSAHTCVVTSVGTVKCWGNGADGRLGYTGQESVRDPSTVGDMSLTCGDSVKEYNEECDDGNFIDGDGCSKICKIEPQYTCRATSGTFSLCAHCGDWVVSLDETCDDGNTEDGDGCGTTCEVETGWDCRKIRGTFCEPIYGDGLVVGPEKCDLGNVAGAVGCSNDSQILSGFYCNAIPPQPSTCWSVCGDGRKSSQEACDDGNIDSGDGCSSGCWIESGWTCYVSCDQSLTCKSVCSNNDGDSSKVGLIVGLCVGLSLCVILLLVVLFFFMSRKRQILIKESDLTLIRKIGEGDFGEVYEAKWKSTTVAVKQRKIDGISEEEIRMFSKEARVMQALPPHPNLVQFLGLCSSSDKVIIVCEYVEKGSVKKFLQEDCGKNTVTKRNQLELCLGICAGMDHLHSNGITHRDLACRNVLVEVKRSGNGSSVVSKISDFGLSVATSKQTRLPVRWTAPEVLKNPRSRNKEADVWSFGVTMYEVFTRCSELPYLGKKNQEVVAFVLGGGHLKEPPQVDGIIRDVMMDCFKFKPEWRPPFITLSARFEDIIKDMTNPTMTSNETFSTIDTVDTTSLQMFNDDDENDYMSMAKSEYSTSALTSSNVKKGNTYEVVKSTDYESLAK